MLRPYHAVVTGSHPEYHTPNTLNALQDYVDGGGRLAYLGGNESAEQLQGVDHPGDESSPSRQLRQPGCDFR